MKGINMAKKTKHFIRETTDNIQLLNHIGNISIPYCLGCSKIDKNFCCTVYASPTDVCRLGCAFSISAKEKLAEQENRKDKQRIGQQKQKKKK